MEDFKKQDIKAIIDYLGKTGGVAYVDDIMEHSGANRLRVYPILMEFYLEERLEVLEQTDLGGFVKVRLIPSKA
jgi:hypothetical protein